jgi:hypothetical protein
MYKKYDKNDQKLMATWAADCAERVLPLFEKQYPNDDRPRKAIELCRGWVRTGAIRIPVMRAASFGAHAAAREAKENDAVCFAARAAGQAVATAHVTQHAFGGAYYALKAIAAADPVQAVINVASEWEWELQHAPVNLKEEILKRVVIQTTGNKITIKIYKGGDY